MNNNFRLSQFWLIALFWGMMPVAQAQPTIGEMVGINTKAQQTTTRINRFGFTREFHLWADDIGVMPGGQTCPFSNESDNVKLRWNPSKNHNKYVRFDDFYAYRPQRIIPVLHGNAPMMYPLSDTLKDLFAKPICPNLQSNVNAQQNPASWLQYAMWTSLFAARYGAAPTGGFPVGFQNIADKYVETPDNMNLGKGLVRYVEIFNEPDNTWLDSEIDVEVTGAAALDTTPLNATKFYFRPREYAAMLSAAFDGNKKSPEFAINNASGVGVGFWGIKNLSSNVKVVLGGTADTRSAYLAGLVSKWDAIRGTGDYPVDILNFHFYSTKDHPAIGQDDWQKFLDGRKFFSNTTFFDFATNTNGNPNNGQFPEATNVQLRERIAETIAKIPEKLNSKPVWITEFGYDLSEDCLGYGWM